MFQREKPIGLKSSASLISNNLAVYVNPDRTFINYAVVHKSTVNIVTASTDGTAITYRQTACKDPTATTYNSARNIIMQATWVALPTRLVFVLASQNGIQMYEGDGSTMLYWQAIGDGEKGPPEAGEGCAVEFARGICGMSKNIICVGTSMGQIFVYNIPAKGTKVQQKATLFGHENAICDLTAQDKHLVSSDTNGCIIVWTLDEGSSKLTKHVTINGSGSPCSSIAIWQEAIIGGYGNGYIRVFDLNTGTMGAEVTAHARWIHSIDVAKDVGLVMSASEDSFVRIWQLARGSPPQILHVHNECIADTQLVGGAFIHGEGKAFCVTGYDTTELVFHVRA